MSACPITKRKAATDHGHGYGLAGSRGLHALDDDVGSTINYSAIARLVRDVVDERRDKLIETLAEKIAERLLRDLPIRRLRIELRKFILPDAAHVSVIITRDRLAGRQ